MWDKKLAAVRWRRFFLFSFSFLLPLLPGHKQLNEEDQIRRDYNDLILFHYEHRIPGVGLLE